MMALGIVMYVWSLTVYLVCQGTLDDYVYLEHGAHYPIGALAVIRMVTVQYEINEVITGLVGVVLIAWSFWSSVRRNRALAAAEIETAGADQDLRLGLDSRRADVMTLRQNQRRTSVKTFPQPPRTKSRQSAPHPRPAVRSRR